MLRFGRWILLAIGLLVIGAVLMYVRANDPRFTGIFPTCVFHKYTGLHCPGCGGTRAAHALLNGDVVAAVAWNPFALVGIPTVVALWLYDRRMRRSGSNGLKYLAQVVLVLVVAFFILRNVPNPQHGLLAPWDIRSAADRDSH